MKIIFLLRHASANQFQENLEDHEKILNNEGKKQSELIAKWLKENNFSIDCVRSSTAKRAMETSKIVFDYLKIPIASEKALYLCSSTEIIDLLKNLDDQMNSIAVVGHEPSISETLKLLVGDARPDLEAKIKDAYPTGGLSIINLNIEKWIELKEKEGTLDAFLEPEDLEKYE